MLSPDDVALIARDAAIPGLATLLDRDLFLATLREKLPGARLLSARTTYLRYKPGTSCLAGYELQTHPGGPDGAVDVQAKAFRADDRGKFRKASKQPALPGKLGAGLITLEEHLVVVSVFPNDGKLESLRLLAEPDSREQLLRRLLPGRPDLRGATLRKLAYKPARRFVAQLAAGGEPAAVLKCYTAAGYEAAERNARVLKSRGTLRVAARLGRSRRRRVLATEWLPGRPLGQILDDETGDFSLQLRTLSAVGAALAELHGQRGRGMSRTTTEVFADRLRAAAGAVGAACPHIADRARGLARRISVRLREPKVHRPIHGDFHAEQVVIDADAVGILDLDEAGLGDPAVDLGNFVAHVENHSLRGRLRPDRIGAMKDALLEGYRAAAGRLPRGIEFHTAVGLFSLAPHTFRRREADWAKRTEAALDRTEAILDAIHRRVPGGRAGDGADAVTVSDPFNVVADPTMAFVGRALDPGAMSKELKRCLRGPDADPRRVDLRAIRVTRHKPGLRCLIEYDLDVRRHGAAPEAVTVIGKVRAKATDETTFRVVETLWSGEFGPDSPDGISVAPPAGIAPDVRMWLQHKVKGVPATGLVAGPAGVELVRRLAEAAAKLHRCPAPTHRRHRMSDELRILRDRLSLLAREQPRWADRLETIFGACDRLASRVPEPRTCGVHRDFYADQAIVDGPRLYLLDFDLYCIGDPGLDVGNFIGHLTEQALRSLGDPDALADRATAMEERFVELSGEQVRPPVRAYAALTLARLISVSARIPDRRQFTEALIQVNEQRLLRGQRT